MKKRSILVITFVIGLFGLAWAAYDARLAELKQEMKAEPGLTEEDTRDLTKLYEDYNTTRNNTLSALLEMLRRTDNNPQANNYWAQAKAIYDVIDGRKSGLKGKLSKSGEKLLTIFTTAEFLFNLRLTTSKLPVRRDEIVALNANLVDYTAKLDEKWKALLSADQSYDDQEKAIARELRGIVEEMIAGVAEANKTAKEKVQKMVSLGLTLTPLAGLDMAKDLAVGLFDKKLEWLIARQKDIIRRMNDYRNIVSYEKNGINVLFDQTYYDTKKFIEENGFDRAKALYVKAREDADALSAQGSAGVRADSKEFAEQALKVLSDHVASMETTFNRFVGAHKGKFFGPVGPELEEALLETRAWEQEVKDVKGLGLEGKLREWRSNTPLLLSEIDQANLTPETRKVIKDTLAKNIQALVDAVKTGEEALSDQFWIVNYDRSELARQIKSGKN